jgi:hypothetical protein
MEILKTSRSFNRYSVGQLTRARRLWVYLNFEAFWAASQDDLDKAALHAIDRGLYSPVSGKSAVLYSLHRQMFKLYRIANPDQYRGAFGWRDYVRDWGCMWFPEKSAWRQQDFG